MNQTRLTIAFLAVLAAAPLRASDSPSYELRGRAMLDSVGHEALVALNQRASTPFRAVASPRTGRALSIWGGELGLAQDVERAALSFLTLERELFGLAAGLELSTNVRGVEKRRVYVDFQLDGLPIDGLRAVVLFDAQGALVGAQVAAVGDVEALGAHVLSDVEGERVAFEHLGALRQRLSRLESKVFDARSERVWHASPSGLVPALRVSLASSVPGEHYVIVIDARDGRELRIADRVTHATGQFPLFDQQTSTLDFVTFPTESTKGSAYKNQSHAAQGKDTKRTFKNWAHQGVADVGIPPGFLVGARADIWDDLSDQVDDAFFKPNGGFIADDENQDQRFDQANTYFQIESFYGHLKQNLGQDINANFALPVIVNIQDGTLNAFFAPALFPFGEHTFGFLAFFDVGPFVGDPVADFSRDPSVVDHEHTHAWIFFEGESFDSNVDEPPRAVGEAIPDFFACAKQKTETIGSVVDLWFPDVTGGATIARDLQDDDHFPETTLDAMALTGDLPEEHRNGEVFGSLLTDVRLQLGTKRTERIVFDALPFMPNTMDEIGFGPVDATNAVDATIAYFDACTAGLLQGSSTAKDFLAILGAATARGVWGGPSSVTTVLFDLDSFAKDKVTIPSAFVVANPDGVDDPEVHFYFFTAPEGRQLDVTIQAVGQSQVKPDFVIIDPDAGVPDPVLETQPKQFSGNGKKVTQEDIQLLMQTGDAYLIKVMNKSTGTGRYTLTLDI